MKGALLVCGTSSDAGKSVLVAGLCRWLARQGVSVAPFKAQNMALNSFVTAGGGEIGRAQAAQAMAAGVEPEVAMNPILLKPTGDRQSQVIVMGHPVGTLDAREFISLKERYMEDVLGALDDLRNRFAVVILEGAGSPAEINLAEGDLVNLGLAARRSVPAILVGDIERGGVFASLFGTVALQSPERRALLRGFVINKFRGDPSLLTPGIEEIAGRTGMAYLGTVPFVEGLDADAEDSLVLQRWESSTATDGPAAPVPAGGDLLGSDVSSSDLLGSDVSSSDLLGSDVSSSDLLDVAVIRLPRISNFTDLDPLRAEPAVSVRLVSDPRSLGVPDLVVIPGTKATVADLAWLDSSGMAGALRSAHREGSVILGICGGYQMLGRFIHDGVESGAGTVEGLGLLDAETVFDEEKVTAQRRGHAERWCLGSPVISGYEIHHGRTKVGGSCLPFAMLDAADSGARGAGAADAGTTGTETEEGAVAVNRRVYGTSLHGLFEEDGFRAAFLFALAESRGKRFAASGLSFARLRAARLDRLADLVADHLDTGALVKLIGEAPPPGDRTSPAGSLG